MMENFSEDIYHKKILNGFRAGFKLNGMVYMKQVRDQIADETYVDKHFDKDYMLTIWHTAFDEKENRLAKASAQKNAKRAKLKEVNESDS